MNSEAEQILNEADKMNRFTSKNRISYTSPDDNADPQLVYQTHDKNYNQFIADLKQVESEQ